MRVRRTYLLANSRVWSRLQQGRLLERILGTSLQLSGAPDITQAAALSLRACLAASSDPGLAKTRLARYKSPRCALGDRTRRHAVERCGRVLAPTEAATPVLAHSRERDATENALRAQLDELDATVSNQLLLCRLPFSERIMRQHVRLAVRAHPADAAINPLKWS